MNSYNNLFPEDSAILSGECSSSNPEYYKGKSFNFAGKWILNSRYVNDEYITDFVSYKGALLACHNSNLSSSSNEPVLQYDEAGVPIDCSSPEWDFVLSGISGKTGDNGEVYVPIYDDVKGTIKWTLYDSPVSVPESRVKGDKGDSGRGIIDIHKIGSVGIVDNYKITYSDGTHSIFTVKNGLDGINGKNGLPGQDGRGISRIALDHVSGILDHYRVEYTDGTSWLFTVKNGTQGPKGNPGDKGVDGKDGKDGKDGLSATIRVGSVETISPNESANIINVGTATEAVFKFLIPQGQKGDTGERGPEGQKGDTGERGPEGRRIKLFRDFSDDTIKWGYDGEPTSEWTTLCYMEYLKGVHIDDVDITDDARLKITLSNGHWTYHLDENGEPIKDQFGNIVYDKWIPNVIITEGKTCVTVSAGKVETLNPDEDARVENAGTIKDPVFDFYIPKGFPGRHSIHVGPEDPITYRNNNLNSKIILESYETPEEMIWVDTSSNAEFDHLNAVYHAYLEAGGDLSFVNFKKAFIKLGLSVIEFRTSFEELGEPTESKKGILWIVPTSVSSESNLFSEYVVIEIESGYAWEKLGDASINLSNYYNKTEIDAMIKKLEDQISGGTPLRWNGFSVN